MAGSAEQRHGRATVPPVGDGFLIFAVKENSLNRLVEVGLIAFDGQQVIYRIDNDFLDNGVLAALRINTHHEAFQIRGIKQFQNTLD